MTTTKLRMTASRSRRHEVEWTRIGGPTTSRTIRSTTSTGCSVGAELEDPRLRPVRAGELEPVAVEPDDEDLGLDRAVDVPTGGFAAHRVIVGRVIAGSIGAIMPGPDRPGP